MQERPKKLLDQVCDAIRLPAVFFCIRHTPNRSVERSRRSPTPHTHLDKTVAYSIENRCKHYAYCTEETYVLWIRPYILFHNKRYPSEMDTPEVTQRSPPSPSDK